MAQLLSPMLILLLEGVVMWEIFERNTKPFPDLGNLEVMQGVASGKLRLGKPTCVPCSDEVWAIMSSCWLADPQARPSFSALHERLEQALKAPKGTVYANVSEVRW